MWGQRLSDYLAKHGGTVEQQGIQSGEETQGILPEYTTVLLMMVRLQTAVSKHPGGLNLRLCKPAQLGVGVIIPLISNYRVFPGIV